MYHTLGNFKGAEDLEVIVHELNPTATLIEMIDELSHDVNIKYIYTKYSTIFNKSWALNYAVKKVATGEMLCLFDADIIVPRSWLNIARRCIVFCAGFREITYLSSAATEQYYQTGVIDAASLESTINKTKKNRSSIIASNLKAPGGILFIPRDVYTTVKGYDECYTGAGCYDLAFLHKMERYMGMARQVTIFKDTVYHLYHPFNTIRLNAHDARQTKEWSYKNWADHINKIGDNWGRPLINA